MGVEEDARRLERAIEGADDLAEVTAGWTETRRNKVRHRLFGRDADLWSLSPRESLAVVLVGTPAQVARMWQRPLFEAFDVGTVADAGGQRPSGLFGEILDKQRFWSREWAQVGGLLIERGHLDRRSPASLRLLATVGLPPAQVDGELILDLEHFADADLLPAMLG